MDRLSTSQKRILAVVLLAGGSGGIGTLGKVLRNARKEQKALCLDLRKTEKKQKQVAAVDKKFVKRLLRILGICLPGVFSKEVALVLMQGGLLFSRTILTLRISKVEGLAAQSITSLDYHQYWVAIMRLAAVGVPAAVINAGLKYMQKKIQLAFQERVTKHLHTSYCSNRAYYAASILGGLTNADQRITEDVEKFALSISELYDRTFKPLLDVILFTRALAPVMGYQGPILLYSYFILTGLLLKALSPPLAQMTAEESALTGAYRAAHQRLVMYSEEVAVNDPPGGAAEELILNEHLARYIRYVELSSLLRFAQKIADEYFVKYLASSISLLVYGAPLYFNRNSGKKISQGEQTSQYIRSVRLLQNTSRGIGDLVLVYKRVTSLAGHTSRVAELLEQVEHLSKGDSEHRALFQGGNDGVESLEMAQGSQDLVQEHPRSPISSLPPPQRLLGDTIKFERVAVDSPDGTPLLRELTFEVAPGHSVMLMGPNGSGKSSLMRVLGGLWPIMGGTVVSPGRGDIFYLSQRPYVVTGTLRDQLIYPDPPRKAWESSSRNDRRSFVRKKGRAPRAVNEADLLRCLQAVELEYLLERGRGWDQFQKWEETLSGGERQRIAMARLLYHRPKFAVLDEATSAVSADGEKVLYESCRKSGITMLSIGHRPSLKQFHSVIVHVDGNQNGLGWSLEQVE